MLRQARTVVLLTGILTVVWAGLSAAGSADTPGDVDALRRQLEEQRALIREQRQLLEVQQQRLDDQTRKLDRLSQKLEEMVAARQEAAQPPEAAVSEPVAAARAAVAKDRDAIGDLNASAVRAGDFPGSFRIPGPGKISLAIGGFVKTVVIADSDAEAMGADFLPATLGTRGEEDDGDFSVDATLTRLDLDGRAPVPKGQVRGYVEYDLNNQNNGTLDFNLRHAFGSWITDYGTLLAGHTWSTMMDLGVIPEGLTEPTVSGVIFQRQAMVRWSQPLTPELTYHLAAEDPDSNDVFGNQAPGNQSVPDVVLGLDYQQGSDWHLRLNGIARRIQVDTPGGGSEKEPAWGTSVTGHLSLLERDRLRFSGVYGKGLGRYLLGILSTAGAALDPEGDLKTLENWGGMAAYEHHWTDSLRSTAMLGYARSDPKSWQPGDTFESSVYGSANLMWQVQPYVTVGIEYAYGNRENKDGSDVDNHRVAAGVQVF